MVTKAVGLHLAPEDSEATGIAEYEDGRIRTFSLYKMKDIIEVLEDFKPSVVVINSPLSIIDKSFRSAEIEMKTQGFSVEPVNTEKMKKLAVRGIHIKHNVEKFSQVIESNASLVRQALKIDNHTELNNVRFMNLVKNEHEKEAILTVIAGVFYLDSIYHQFGDEKEGFVIVPKL